MWSIPAISADRELLGAEHIFSFLVSRRAAALVGGKHLDAALDRGRAAIASCQRLTLG
jgi:hypothetical protein